MNYTVSNIKFLASFIKDFENESEVSAKDFINKRKQYFKTVSKEDASWIKTTFMGIQRYRVILEVALNPEYFKRIYKHTDILCAKIILYGILFDIPFEEKETLYKVLLNINAEMAYSILFHHLIALDNISMTTTIACQLYEPDFVNEKISAPLLKWKPLFENMRESYEHYKEELDQSRKQPVTKPVAMVLGSRPRKKTESPEKKPESEITQTKDTKPQKPVKMLTKVKIDEKLSQKFKANKERAENLYVEANILSKNYLKNKTEKYYDTVSRIRQAMELELQPQPISKKTPKFPEVEIKPNKAHVERMQNVINMIQEGEVKFIKDITSSCRDTTQVNFLKEQINEDVRIFEENEKERKHILAQMAYEEAILAKEKVKSEKKKKYLETIEEKKRWVELLGIMKKQDEEKKKEIIEKITLYELYANDSKSVLSQEKRNAAEVFRKSKMEAWQKELEKRDNEYNERVKMIKELRAIENLRKEARLPKVIDFTETGGYQCLNEMSLAELAERLIDMKVDYYNNLEEKKKEVLELRINQDKRYKKCLDFVNENLIERKEMREIDKNKLKKKNMKKVKITSEENAKLRKLLELKRNQRKLNNQKSSKDLVK